MLSHVKNNLAFSVSRSFIGRGVASSSCNRNTPVDVPLRKSEGNDAEKFIPPYDRFKRSIEHCQPHMENSFEGDAFLKRNLQRVLPGKAYNAVENELTAFGARVATELYKLGRECELSQPYIRLQNAWGNPHNEVVTCEAWKQLKKESAKEGLIATAYERDPDHRGFSRLIQMTKIYMFYPSSGLYSCPLAMTDGAAKTLEVMSLKDSEVFKNLTTRDQNKFFTSGQWMTEKLGGSDVAGGTETMAVLDSTEGGNMYRLYGYKWFSSATDADVALTLARVVDPSTRKTTSGTAGLSLFLVDVRQPEHLRLLRLKQKLGTRQLPTGELFLDGMRAKLISPIGRGVASISPMLSITRLHNAACSVSAMRRVISLARDYSNRRFAFGKLIRDHPLHIRTLAEMELECRAGLVLFFEAARLLSLEESGTATDNDTNLLRLLLPLLKLYTGKQCVKIVSEGLEAFGGQGYMEDTGIPVLLRDAQVTPIWEGTTSILSLDVLRALAKSKGQVLHAYNQRIQGIVDLSDGDESCSHLNAARAQMITYASKHADKLEYFARDFAFGLARTLAGALLLEHATTATVDTDRAAAQRWLTSRDLLPASMALDAGSCRAPAPSPELDFALVFDGYDAKHIMAPLF